MPYLYVNPYSHIGILRSGRPCRFPNRPPEEINRLLFWRYYQAMNKNSAGGAGFRRPDAQTRLGWPLDQTIKDEAQDAFDRRFRGKK